MRTLATFLVLSISSVTFAQAKPAGSKEPAAAPYKWDAQTAEKFGALVKKADLKAGEATWDVCAGCHLPNGAGRPDGLFPQLAGQHATVLVKQLADVRAGARDNPMMHPFTTALTDAQVANVAAYVSSLAVPHDNGTGSGAALGAGIKLYERDCKSCHGVRGEGDAAKYIPVLAGQHYNYLLHQATDIRDGRRRNANPDMLKVIKPYTTAELDAVADYMSRLNMPERKK